MSDRKADIVVAGGGGAGLAAAVMAAQDGDSVLLITNRDELGGATSRSIGVFAAAGTRLQKEQGIVDSSEQFLRDYETMVSEDPKIESLYWTMAQQREDPKMRRLLFSEAPKTLDWLMDLGLPIKGPFLLPPYKVPRAHITVPDSRALIDGFYPSLNQLKNIHIEYNTSLIGLESQTQGQQKSVNAVRVKQGEAIRTIGVEKSVILATGDFSASSNFRQQYTSDWTTPSVCPFNTGEGIRAAAEIGAAIRNMDLQEEALRLGPPLFTGVQWANLAKYGAVLVNLEGRRFVDELDKGEVLPAVKKQAEEACYVIFDQAVADTFSAWPRFISTFPGLPYAYTDEYKKTGFLSWAETLTALAEKIKLPGLEGLEFPKSERPTAPYYALGPLRPYVVFTDGGVMVNEKMQVLEPDGKPILGLYAAGATAQGNITLASGGLHVAWAFTSGRIAGEMARK